MPTPEQVQLAIARNVRAFRTRRGMSLDDLATRSSVSRAMIVQIEQGRTNPSVNTLCLLAEALGESVPALVDVNDSEPVRLVPASEAVELWRGKRGSRAVVLAGAGTSGPVELWHWRLRYGDPYDAPPHAAGTREMLFVVSGELLLTVGEAQYRAAEGETLLFHATESHRYAAAARAGVELVMVVLEPPAAATLDLHRPQRDASRPRAGRARQSVRSSPGLAPEDRRHRGGQR